MFRSPLLHALSYKQKKNLLLGCVVVSSYVAIEYQLFEQSKSWIADSDRSRSNELRLEHLFHFDCHPA
jgi:hypothetical protein